MSLLKFSVRPRLVSRIARPAASTSPTASLLHKQALRTPGDPVAWKAVYAKALEEREFELAESAARALGDEAPLYLADLAIIRGVPAEAVLILKDRDDMASRLRLAWACFSLGQYGRAADLWSASSDADAAAMGQVLQAVTRKKMSREMVPVLKQLSTARATPVVAAASKVLAEYLAQSGAHAKALPWARRAEWIMPYDLSLKRLIAHSASHAGNPEMGLAKWREILSIHPDDAESHEMLGHALLAKGDTATAVRHFDQALDSDPFRTNLRIILGDISMDSNRVEEAVDHWETALRVNPRDKEAMSRLAELAWEDGELPEALRLFLQLKALGLPREEDEENCEIIGYLYGELMLGGGGEYDKAAIAFFQEALKAYPTNPFVRIYEARRLIAGDQFAPARVIITSVLQSNPFMPEAVFEMGNLLILEGQFDQGMTYLLKAAQLDHDAFYKKEIGKNYLEHEDWSRAEKWFKKALSSGSEDEEIMLGLHLSCFNQKKFSLSENILRRVLSLLPRHMQAQMYLAETLMHMARFDEAHKLIQGVADHCISYEEFMAGKGEGDLVVDPAGAVVWLMGFSCAFLGKFRSANRHFTLARAECPQVEVWFDDLKIRLKKELESGSRRSSRTGALIIFQA
ncbi:MAG: tetratricopeptide repeat protein [Candidatus Hydrogenedentota bacterium]